MKMEIIRAGRIGARLRAARERANLTQQELATALGFENRQTLASIESGDRRLSASELLEAVRVLGADLDYFTDSFRLVGEGRFSFRARQRVAPNVLDRFEEQAGRWIATYRELGAEQGAPSELVGLKLALDSQSSYEDAQAAAESLGRRWQLGAVPATLLQDAMEQYLGALILHVDAPSGISGAASQLPGLTAVLVNRNETEGRRHYDLAHELFHLLTWDAMPPKRVEEVADGPLRGKGNRVEQLAENFAAALLMPADLMRAHWDAREQHTELYVWLNATAAALRVSVVACKWRLHNLGCLSKADVLAIGDKDLSYAHIIGMLERQPLSVRPFSERFVKRIAVALDTGRLSARRAASLLAISLSELAALLQSYGAEASFEA